MLTPDEEKFLIYWEKNRDKKPTLLSQLSIGLPLGLLLCAGILLNYVSGWYSRATMVANGQSTPLVLIVAFVLIIIFCSVFFKRHQREMNEQRYLELSYRKKLENSSASKQQEDDIDSQVSS
ncbi:MAG: hypothetical protein M3040_14135 [Bacteroidota bacterium]|nr:hypothetical protein [Bacteroidota bacterium]